ncbi:SMP-30/gluconolactonase/LRE family protein [Methyloceanibacter caenitepidi]|uniref:Putative periplasmic ATP/GTP-binding protein n=1 Tax=Methyloceanibacter caenitepidi TaxID=1384459 RepID=A0A0A8K3U7_9HYPH|nr:SMP-30/gluconolactonase/LRE family protein [Methyloceanibacter caenitepidi]BAQ16674.1 putative periplasmic ATP/GTP-binding protein [Methyloceanibacter caenitepidi]
MSRITSLLLATTLVAVASIPSLGLAAELKEVWRAEGLRQPESVLFDPERNVLYVSNVDGGPTDKDGKGYIAKLTPDGKVETAEWVTGLNAPKGLGLYGDRLYVADIDRLVVIDIGTGEISKVYEAPDAKFLNDIAVDKDGRVFVSDTLTDTIYALDGNTFGVWLNSGDLAAPNGLYADNDKLIVASWGKGEMMSAKPDHLRTVDLDTKEIANLGDGTPIGNLDGIAPDGAGDFLVTDWVAGALFRVQPSGKAERLLDLNQGTADLFYRSDEKLVMIPFMNDGVLVAYRLEP